MQLSSFFVAEKVSDAMRRVCDGLGSVDEGDGPALRPSAFVGTDLTPSGWRNLLDELKMAELRLAIQRDLKGAVPIFLPGGLENPFHL